MYGAYIHIYIYGAYIYMYVCMYIYIYVYIYIYADWGYLGIYRFRVWGVPEIKLM